VVEPLKLVGPALAALVFAAARFAGELPAEDGVIVWLGLSALVAPPVKFKSFASTKSEMLLPARVSAS
jgi:membrane protein implicated in regulation of membrane protease activity